MMEETNNKPLVSVPVITYNSSKYVLETLESIKDQSYQNIELIISDDCSTDNTVELCQKWINDNCGRFVRTEIITSPVNKGVSANGNRAHNACNGEWIKSIAGDDLLLPNCISDFVEYVQQNPDTILVFGKVRVFGSETEEEDRAFENKHCDYSFFTKSANEQYRSLLDGCCVFATGCFLNAKKAEDFDITNDESIPMVEDLPKWLKITKRGIKMLLLDKYVAAYRVGHSESLCNGNMYNHIFAKSDTLCYLYYRFPDLYQTNPEKYLQQLADLFCELLEDNHKQYNEINRLSFSRAYRLGKVILKPFSVCRRIIVKLRKRIKRIVVYYKNRLSKIKVVLSRIYYSVKHIRINPKNIPIIINNFNRFGYLKRLVASLQKRGYHNIFILDNASTYPPLLEYYEKECTCKIIKLDRNLGHKALYVSGVIKQFNKSYFVYTDPDLELIGECPDDFLSIMLNKMRKHPTIDKIALSLKIDDIPDCYTSKDKVIEWESRFHKIRKHGMFLADVDTTFAFASG